MGRKSEKEKAKKQKRKNKSEKAKAKKQNRKSKIEKAKAKKQKRKSKSEKAKAKKKKRKSKSEKAKAKKQEKKQKRKSKRKSKSEKAKAKKQKDKSKSEKRWPARRRRCSPTHSATQRMKRESTTSWQGLQYFLLQLVQQCSAGFIHLAAREPRAREPHARAHALRRRQRVSLRPVMSWVRQRRSRPSEACDVALRLLLERARLRRGPNLSR